MISEPVEREFQAGIGLVNAIGQHTTASHNEAMLIAGALGFIEALPEGFESWIGQQGLNLSGGQRQRLGIARAVLRDPDLLILDEATNALDAALEDGIRVRLRRAFAGRTLVLVTHREDVALTADHVVRLQGGRVVASGAPHAVLGPLRPVVGTPPAGARAWASRHAPVPNAGDGS